MPAYTPFRNETGLAKSGSARTSVTSRAISAANGAGNPAIGGGTNLSSIPGVVLPLIAQRRRAR
jgi:hypothetical protein